MLYLTYKAKQLDADLLKKIAAKENDVEQKFNTFRAKVDGKEMTDSEVMNVLKGSKDSGAAPQGLGGEQGGRFGPSWAT